ncbi:hypothetical protein ACWD1W_40485 [Streptomyces olivaceoviridis]
MNGPLHYPHACAGQLPVIGWHTTSTVTGLGWGMLVALFCGGIPIAVIMLGVK